ncbi:hypothetical protein Tco_1175051 [Tanacetum coccineum]
MESQSETSQTVSALKLPVLKTREYDLWSMRMEQYLTFTDHALWEVIVNGDSVSPMNQIALTGAWNITNEIVNIAHSVSAASSKDQASTASYADDVMAPRNQGNRNRDAPRRNAESGHFLLMHWYVQDGIWVVNDWSFQAEKQHKTLL